VFGRVRSSQGRLVSLGVQRVASGEVSIKVDGQVVRSMAELASRLPLQVMNTGSFDLLSGAPAARRQFLDWGVFHVEHRFLGEWQRYQRCLKQRNALLRRDKLAVSEMEVWSRELIEAGEAISYFRGQYFEQLSARFHKVLDRLAPNLKTLDLRFRPGWDRKHSLLQALELSLKADLDQGYTHVGPQRADLRIQVGAHTAADTLSRGQQKLVVCALKLAQGQLMREGQAGECIYLVDDLPAELDGPHTQLVCEELASLGAQVFITCIDARELEMYWPDGASPRVFHVEHGKVRPANPAED
jgi:DNA replication and repair protein RecF